MLMITQRLREARAPDAHVEMPFAARSRSRARATLDNGEPVGIIVERGQVLRDGDLLLADDGRAILVRAAAERVSTVLDGAPGLLLRAAYHLGNRHVALQITAGWLRYLHDHVLDEMVRGLGLAVRVEDATFEPEAGAYAARAGEHAEPGHGAQGSGAHDHGHGHSHSG